LWYKIYVRICPPGPAAVPRRDGYPILTGWGSEHEVEVLHSSRVDLQNIRLNDSPRMVWLYLDIDAPDLMSCPLEPHIPAPHPIEQTEYLHFHHPIHFKYDTQSSNDPEKIGHPSVHTL
jgi:hypothetical protein